jgi:hypothetical protein
VGAVVVTALLIAGALLLALALFIAGAMWRGRVTSGRFDTKAQDSRLKAHNAEGPTFLPVRVWDLSPEP